MVEERVPPIWVHGVISQLQIRGRVAYLSLTQYKEESEKPIATLNLICFVSVLEQLNQKTLALAQPFTLKVDLKVSVLLESDFYVPHGKFQPRLVDIDPNFTLGEMAQTRQLIISRLQKEGLLAKNRNLTLSATPLKIGLISAAGSAAYRDFCSVFETSKFAVSILFVSAKMQGETTTKSILAAIQKFKEQDIDCLCIVRGGGAKTDLVYFDSEAICREIAHFPKPVLAGIGHEIDQSIMDRVAWESCITPTDTAMFLFNRLEASYQKWLTLKKDLLSLSRQRLQDHNEHFVSLEESIGQTLKNRLSQERLKLNALQQKFPLLWSFKQKNLTKELDVLGVELRRRALHRWQIETDRLKLNLHGFSKGSSKLLQSNKLLLAQRILRLKGSALHQVEKAHKELSNQKVLVAARSPKNLLRKGYTLTSQKNGKKLNWQKLKIGDQIKTHTQNGVIFSEIKEKSE
jgi:exodeoxyribonuclease VII large subunit